MNNVEDEAHLLMTCSEYTDLINHLIFRHLRWPTLVSVAQRSAHCRHSAL